MFECSSVSFKSHNVEHNFVETTVIGTAGNINGEVCKVCLERSIAQPWKQNLSCGAHGCSVCDAIHKGSVFEASAKVVEHHGSAAFSQTIFTITKLDVPC